MVDYHRTIKYYIDDSCVHEQFVYAGDPNTYNLVWNYTYSNLSPNTGYKLTCKIFRNYDWAYLWGDTLWPATKKPPKVVINDVSAQSGHIRPEFHAYGYFDDKGYGCNTVYCTLYDDSVALERLSKPYVGNGVYDFKFKTPKKYKQYRIAYGASNAYGDNSSNQVYTMIGYPPRPSYWQWSKEAENAFNGRGYTDKLTAEEWNRFIDKVIEVCEWFKPGYSEDLKSKKVSRGDPLKAADFNYIREKIGGMYSTGIYNLNPGDEVKGWYFIKIGDSLNKVE